MAIRGVPRQQRAEHSGLNIHAGNEQTVPSESLTKMCSLRRSDIRLMTGRVCPNSGCQW
jgi:hypothetical protein